MPPALEVTASHHAMWDVAIVLWGLLLAPYVFRALRAVGWFTCVAVLVTLMIPLYVAGVLAAVATFFVRLATRLAAGDGTPEATAPDDWAPAWVRTPILACAAPLGKAFGAALRNLRHALYNDAEAAAAPPAPGPATAPAATDGDPAPAECAPFGPDDASDDDESWVLPGSPLVDGSTGCDLDSAPTRDEDEPWVAASRPLAEPFSSCDEEEDAAEVPEAMPVAPRIVVLEMPASLVRSMQEWAEDEEVPLRVQVMRELDGDKLLAKFIFRDATVAALAEERLEQMVAMRSWLGVTTGLS
jgi:hypothetical protein